MATGSETKDYLDLGIPPKRIEKKKWTTGQKVGAGFGIAIASGASTIGVLEGLEALGVGEPVIAKYIELKSLGIETAREALDKFTKATGIKIFTAEEESQAPIKESFNGLQFEGLNSVYQNGRWEYVDPKDGLIAGYWNNKEGKFELTSDILRGEWKGLFVSQSLDEIEKSFKDDSYWTTPNWENGVTKIPIPFPINEGGRIEKIKSLIAIVPARKPVFIMGINQISQSKFYLPFSPETGEANYSYTAGTYANPDITINEGSLSLRFDFYKTQQCLTPCNDFPDNPYFRGDKPDLNNTKIALGFPFLEVNKEDIITKSFLNRTNPFLKNQYQILMQMFVEGNHPIDFSFDNFLQDSKGRFIYLDPTQSEIDSQVAEQKEKQNKIEETTAEIKPGQSGYETEITSKTEKAPVIEGLNFNEKTGVYTTTAGGVEAGVFVDGFLGLSPEFIKSLQNEAQKQGKWVIPLPFTPEEAKNIKIVEKNIGGRGNTVIVTNLSNNTTICSPLEAKCLNTWGQELVDFNKNLWQDHKDLEFDLGNNNFIVIKSKDLKFFPHNENVDVGDRLAETNQDVTLEFQQRGSDAVIKMRDYILKIGDVPVFIQSK